MSWRKICRWSLSLLCYSRGALAFTQACLIFFPLETALFGGFFLTFMLTPFQAWRITDPMAEAVFEKLRSRGIKVAVVSNFDTRLRGIMKELGCDSWFDAITVSAEVSFLFFIVFPCYCYLCHALVASLVLYFGEPFKLDQWFWLSQKLNPKSTHDFQVEAEKPNPQIFHHTCEHLGVEPWQAIHVGDDRRNDVWGARDAGCHALLWRSDVDSFTEVWCIPNYS